MKINSHNNNFAFWSLFWKIIGWWVIVADTWIYFPYLHNGVELFIPQTMAQWGISTSWQIIVYLSQNLKNKFLVWYLWRYRFSIHKILSSIRKDVLSLSLLIILQSGKDGNKTSLWSILLLLLKIIGYFQLPKSHLPAFLTGNISIISRYVRFMHLSLWISQYSLAIAFSFKSMISEPKCLRRIPNWIENIHTCWMYT